MGEWKEYKIKDLGLVVTGKTPSSTFPEEFGSEMPFVTPTDFRNYRKRTSFAERNLSSKGIEKLRNKVLPPSSVLVTCIGSDMGKVVMNRVPVITNQQINAIIPNQELVSPDFLYYMLVDCYETLRMYSQAGTAVPILNKGDFEEINLTIPSDLSEQKSITSILSSLDDKIDLLHRQNKALEALAETLFRQWFVEETEKGWETYKFIELVKHVKPGTNFQPKRIEQGVPFLNVRNLNNGFLDYSDISYISEDEYKKVHKNWMPEENDVLISRIGTLGVVAVISRKDLPVAVHYNMINLKAKRTSFQFLYFLLKSKLFQEKYHSIIRQSVQEYVSIEDVESMEINLPISKEKFRNQEKTFIEIFTKIRSNKTQISTLTCLRDTLLPKLMSGEVRVNN